MVSIIGRTARVVEAYLSPEDDRIKIRYSQLVDFDDCPWAETLDLLAKWLLSDPLSRNPSSSGEEDSEIASSLRLRERSASSTSS